MRAEQRLEQRRLAGPVRPHESQHVAAVERAGEVADQRSLAHHHAHLAGVDDDVASSLPGVELQGHRVFILDRRAQSRHPLQSLATSLGLLRVLARDVARDVVRLGGDLLLLLVERALLRQAPLRSAAARSARRSRRTEWRCRPRSAGRGRRWRQGTRDRGSRAARCDRGLSGTPRAIASCRGRGGSWARPAGGRRRC